MPTVWLKLLDNRTSELDPDAKKLRRLLEDGHDVLVTGPIIQQVLHSIQDDQKKKKVYNLLTEVTYVDIEPEDYYHAGFHSDDNLLKNLHTVIAARLSAKLLD